MSFPGHSDRVRAGQQAARVRLLKEREAVEKAAALALELADGSASPRVRSLAAAAGALTAILETASREVQAGRRPGVRMTHALQRSARVLQKTLDMLDGERFAEAPILGDADELDEWQEGSEMGPEGDET